MNKKLTAKIQKLVPMLGEKEAVFSSSIAIEPPERELVLKKGSVYTVFDVRCSIPLDLGLITNVINDVLFDSYYHSDNVSPIQSLEKSIVNINDKINMLSKDVALSEEDQEVQLEFNIIAGVLWGNVLYIVQYGNGKSFLMRSGEIKEVSSTSEGKFSVASGVVNDDDVIVLSTKSFADKFPPEKLLSTSLSPNDLEPDQSSMVLKFLIDAEFTENEMVDFNLPKEKKSSKISKVVEKFKAKKLKKEPKVKPIETLADLSGIAESPGDKPQSMPETGAMPISQQVPERPPAKIEMPKAAQSNMPPSPITQNADSSTSVKIKSELKPKFKPNMKVALLTVAVLLIGSIFATIIIKNNSNGTGKDGDANKENGLTVPREPTETEKQEQPVPQEPSQQEAEKLKMEDIQNKVVRFAAQPFYDIKLADDTSNPKDITVVGSTIAVTDPTSGKIFTSTTDTPKFSAISESFAGIKNALSYDGKLQFIDNEGFKIYDLAAGTVSESFEGDFGISGVYLGNIYSVSGNTLTKYVKSGDALEDSVWAENDDFSKVVSLDIAYSIYTVTSDAKVHTYTSGDKVAFNITGLTPALSKTVDIEADNDYDYIYVADAGKNRVVLFNSSGVLVRQIKLEDETMWNDIRSITVNDEETIMYVLNGTKVYEVDLQKALEPLEETEEEVAGASTETTTDETTDTEATTDGTGDTTSTE